MEQTLEKAQITALAKTDQEDEKQSPELCENCLSPINGNFCSECGQSIESSIKYFWSVILHLLDDIFSFDSRASRTLFPLIFKPGFLTLRYFSGKRVRYVPPLRLYLFVSIIFFIFIKMFIQGDVVTHSQNELSKELAEQQIVLLEKRKASLSASATETQIMDGEASEAKESLAQSTIDQAQEIDKKIARLTYFQSFLDDGKPIRSTVAAELIRLSIKQDNKLKSFKASDLEKLERAQTQLAQLARGEKINLADDQQDAMQISNNADGTLSFDFLSDEANEKLELYTEQLEAKSRKAFTSDRSVIIKESINKAPQLMFILLPIFAALLKIMFIFSKRLYMEHLTVALHSHSFIFVMFLIAELLSELEQFLTPNYPVADTILSPIIILSLCWIPIYLFIMQKKVYQQGLIMTTIKYFVIGNLYVILLTLTSVAAFIWGLTSIQL